MSVPTGTGLLTRLAAPNGPSITLTKRNSRQMKPEEWTNCVNQYATLMQDALSVLYDGIETDECLAAVDGHRESGAFTPDEYTLPQLAQIFSELCGSLCSLLSEPTNGQVRLPLSSVMKVLSRSLRVSHLYVRSKPSMMKLAEVIPIIHQSALKTISQLISSCNNNLLPYSQTIIGLSLQALVTSTFMEMPHKSQTKACIYQVLCLAIMNFGWGSHFKFHLQTLIQDLIADIKLQDASRQVPTALLDQSKYDDLGHQRKGKKKKRNKAESYGDLAGADARTGMNGSDNLSTSIEATVGALELSQLVLANEDDLSRTEILVGCILDTISNIQRHGVPPFSAYIESRCRQGLYSAVFACVTVKSKPVCSRKDSITIFQICNKATYFLNAGLFDSSPEVAQTCQDSVNAIWLSANMDRPVVRRIPPDENNDSRDALELEREVLKLGDENDSLKKRLLESELENQSQSRLVASLRQEIESLRALASKKDDSSVHSHPEAKSTGMETNREESSQEDSSEEDEDEEEEMDNDDKDGVKNVEEVHGDSTTQKEGALSLEEKDRSVVSGSQAKKASDSGLGSEQNSAKSDLNSAVSASNSAEIKDNRKRVADANPESSKKRKTEADSDNRNNNQVDKVPVPSGSKTVEKDHSDNEDSIQAMMSDFVDAGPDLF